MEAPKPFPDAMILFLHNKSQLSQKKTGLYKMLLPIKIYCGCVRQIWAHIIAILVSSAGVSSSSLTARPCTTITMQDTSHLCHL